MPPRKTPEDRAIVDCNTIHKSLTDRNRWTVGILVTCLLATIAIASRVYMAHAANDGSQDVKIARQEVQIEQVLGTHEKLDFIIEQLKKRP